MGFAGWFRAGPPLGMGLEVAASSAVPFLLVLYALVFCLFQYEIKSVIFLKYAGFSFLFLGRYVLC